ncbi:hypothetical protein BH11CYA1_BH11CYA1_25690 [soil metagenome]
MKNSYDQCSWKKFILLLILLRKQTYSFIKEELLIMISPNRVLRLKTYFSAIPLFRNCAKLTALGVICVGLLPLLNDPAQAGNSKKEAVHNNAKKEPVPSTAIKGSDGSSSNKEKPHSKEPRDQWKYSVPVGQISPHQLPVGKLVAHLRKRRVTEVRQLLKDSPVHPGDGEERTMWEAACLATKNRPEQAVVLFDTVKNLSAAPVVVVARAAESYAGEAQYYKAIRLCNIVLAKYDMREAYQVRGGCYSATNRLTEAAADFEKLAVLGGSSPVRYYCRAASLLLKTGKSKEALTMVERGLKAVPGDSSAALQMVKADCFKTQGRWQDAIKCISEAIRMTSLRKISPNGEEEVILATCYKERAACYQKLGQTDLAKKDLKALDDASRGLADEIIGDR